MSENSNSWLDSFVQAFASIRKSREAMTEADLSAKFGDEESQSDDSRQSVIDFLKAKDVRKKIPVVIPRSQKLKYGSNEAIIANLQQRIKDHPESAEYILPQIERLKNS